MGIRSAGLLLLGTLAATGARAQTCDFVPASHEPGFLEQSGIGCFVGTELRRLQSFWRNDCAGESAASYDVTVVWYQDSDGDGAFSPSDAEVARHERLNVVWPPGRIFDFVATPSLVLPEPALPVWVVIDPDGGIAESDESNNAMLLGHPCSADAAATIPLPDLVLAIDRVDYRTTGLPPGDAIATVHARLTNIGATDPAVAVPVLASCATSLPQVIDVLAPPPGASTAFTFDMPFSGIDTLVMDADWTGGSNPPPGLVAECVEDNNQCSRVLDPSTRIRSLARPVGAALRAAGHSPPGAPESTAEFEWLLDEGAPRSPGDSFVVFTSESASRLEPVPMDPPLRTPRWSLVTPRSTAGRVVHYVLVAAADEDGRLAE